MTNSAPITRTHSESIEPHRAYGVSGDLHRDLAQSVPAAQDRGISGIQYHDLEERIEDLSRVGEDGRQIELSIRPEAQAPTRSRS